MSTIQFSLRSDKKDADGRCPIQLTYFLLQNRSSIRIGFSIIPEAWDEKRQRAFFINRSDAKKNFSAIKFNSLPTEKECKVINQRIEDKKREVRDIEIDFADKNIQPSTSDVIDRLREEKKKIHKQIEESAPKFLFEYIERFITSNEKTAKPGSMSVYKALRKSLDSFRKKYGMKISFASLDVPFFRMFQDHLIDEGLNNTTINKRISTLKTFVNNARKDGITVSDSYRNFKVITAPELDVIALSNDELVRLYNFDFSQLPHLDRVRDVFCFGCCTGPRYSDLNELTKDNVVNDVLKYVPKKTTNKTSKVLSVPLNPMAKTILAKYSEGCIQKGKKKLLPVISNAKFNEYIKDACKMAGITDPCQVTDSRGNKVTTETLPAYELISVHASRKTFITLFLERGTPAEVVMSMSGHTNWKSFKRYVKITEDRQKDAVEKAWGVELPMVKQKPELIAV